MVGFFELANEIKTRKNEKSYKTISHESKFTRNLEYIILYTYMYVFTPTTCVLTIY
ncbi:hypothetical protein HanRHA438_Chr17g0798071 [Helianthus annuus]|nr:hypothetical protein HanIR_Chr17g0855141 [Helianthus annuus]KAJ0446380.1 hypothetical protein HanHA89_Chr17g0693671 [Helianthus annuus]KAJ0631322.1 hypothetical protein HanLR1_Chr17g0652721 [Helianthus annuus]KAJ0824966.1 hypothetical protein HanRHA438_Chr17g0798071 [Helianthus annuus]